MTSSISSALPTPPAPPALAGARKLHPLVAVGLGLVAGLIASRLLQR